MKLKKIGEMKICLNSDYQEINFKVWKEEKGYFATDNNPFFMAHIGRRPINNDLADFITTINKIKRTGGKIISNSIPKKIMDLAIKGAILINLK